MKNYIFADCETSGLLKAEGTNLNLQPYITEICLIKTDENLNIIGEYVELFNVPVQLDAKVTEITGITNDMLKDKKPFGNHWREIADFFLGTTRFVAHNATFDRDCIRHELTRLGKQWQFPWPPEILCTIERSTHLKGHRLNLSALHEHLFGAKFEGAHRAEEDVKALIRCYGKLKELRNDTGL